MPLDTGATDPSAMTNQHGEPASPSASTTPSTPSSQAESTRAPGFLRRIMSLGSRDAPSSRGSSRGTADENPLVKKASSLVPPNYTPAFKPRVFEPHQAYNDWAEQVVAFSDNGLRAELADMYAIFASMEQRPLMLDSSDADLFLRWFRTFFAVLAEIFDLEEQVLYVWVEGVDTLPKEKRGWETSRGRVCRELSDVRRSRMKAEIMRIGNDIVHGDELFDGRPVAQALPALATIVEDFVNGLEEYLDVKKHVLPACIRSLLSQRDAGRFYRNFWETALTLKQAQFTIVAATRWMDGRAAAKFRKKRMSSQVRRMYDAWVSTFSEQHSGVVREFEERVRVSEAERVKQAELHGAALARAQDLHDAQPSEYTGSEAASGSCASSLLLRSGIDFNHDSFVVV